MGVVRYAMLVCSVIVIECVEVEWSCNVRVKVVLFLLQTKRGGVFFYYLGQGCTRVCHCRRVSIIHRSVTVHRLL